MTGFLLTAFLYYQHTRNIRHQPGRATLLLALLSTLTAGWIMVRAIIELGLDSRRSAYDSAVLALLGFQGMVAILASVMTLIALAWALLRPGEVRGQAVAWNASLVAYFGAFSAAVVLACTFVWPRLL